MFTIATGLLLYVGIPFLIRAIYLKATGKEGRASTKKWILGVGGVITAVSTMSVIFGGASASPTPAPVAAPVVKEAPATPAPSRKPEGPKTASTDAWDQPTDYAAATKDEIDRAAFWVTWEQQTIEDQALMCYAVQEAPARAYRSFISGQDDPMSRSTFTEVFAAACP
jgi:hypothetical protein